PATVKAMKYFFLSKSLGSSARTWAFFLSMYSVNKLGLPSLVDTTFSRPWRTASDFLAAAASTRPLGAGSPSTLGPWAPPKWTRHQTPTIAPIQGAAVRTNLVFLMIGLLDKKARFGRPSNTRNSDAFARSRHHPRITTECSAESSDFTQV